MSKKIDNIVRHAEVSEKSIERYLVASVDRLGGLCLKYANHGKTGFPDRICLLPDGVTVWVELKSKGGRTSPIQHIRFCQMARIGHPVHVCASKAEIDEVLKPYKSLQR